MATGYSRERQSSRTDLLSPSLASSASPTGSPAPRSSALSGRITSVLSASYADLEIKDALETLDAREIKNTQDTRRNLRLEVQQELIQCNGEIMRDFGQVAEQLKRIGNVVHNLNKCCADMRAHISAAKKETAPMIEETKDLLEQKGQTETKQHLLDAFTKHFLMSESELAVLTSSAEPVDDEFYRLLSRAKKIHQDSQVLLGTENQSLGLEILEQSSKHLNAAFQKLFRWVEREFKTLDLENPQISASIRRALRALAERPTLFQACLDFFAEAREQVLYDGFYTALTGSSSDPDYVPPAKPIEFHAHDPVRYVGDLLAWTHSATVSEREALEVLFISEGDEMAKGIQAGIESEPWNRTDGSEEPFDGRRALNGLVSRDLTGVSRLLRQRTEQVIQSHDDAALAYRIANLIGFYQTTFAKLLGGDAALLDVMAALEESAMKQFRVCMKDNVVAIQDELAAASANLSPPEYLHEALETLKVLMKSFETSAAATSDGEAAFEPILTDALDPFLKGCEAIGKTLPSPAKEVFAINCLLAARTALAPFPFTQQRATEIGEVLDEYAMKLIEHQHQYFLRESGIQPLLAAISALSESEGDTQSLPTLQPFKPEVLTAISQQLDDFLPSALMDATENIQRLRNPKVAQDITEEAADRFCEDFEMLESKILAADELRATENGPNGEVSPRLRDMFPRTSGEIRVLLS